MYLTVIQTNTFFNQSKNLEIIEKMIPKSLENVAFQFISIKMVPQVTTFVYYEHFLKNISKMDR